MAKFKIATTKFPFFSHISQKLQIFVSLNPHTIKRLPMSDQILFRELFRSRIKMLTVNIMIWSHHFHCFQNGCQRITGMVFGYYPDLWSFRGTHF